MFLKRILNIYSQFTGEFPFRNVISVKLCRNLIKITFQHGVFSYNFEALFRTVFHRNNFVYLRNTARGQQI